MRKISIIMGLCLVFVFAMALQGWAFVITYTGTDPNYVITDNGSGNGIVGETYGATSLTPFPSHDGFAVVDFTAASPTTPIYFTKVMTYSAQDVTKKNFEMTFNIKNNTLFTWSDYHFLFENEGQVITKAFSADFKGVTITTPTEIDTFFDPPGGKLVAPGDTLQVNFTFNLAGLKGFDIGTTQIATAGPVPIPPSALLLGSGLLGLVGFGWRRKKG